MPSRKQHGHRRVGMIKKSLRVVGQTSARSERDGTMAVAEKSGTTTPGIPPARTDASIDFHVRGLPAAQGSTRAYIVKGKPIITTSSKGLATWRRLVADVAQNYAPSEPWEGPVAVELDFGIPKPKSAPKRRRVWPAKRPDLDKLARAILDALTYVIFADDSQVVELHASKDYGVPGVVVHVRRVTESLMDRP